MRPFWFFFSLYMPMHDVTPKVVAIAVSTVMITCNTLLQISFFSMMCFDFMIYDVWFLIYDLFHHWVTRSLTEFFIFLVYTPSEGDLKNSVELCVLCGVINRVTSKKTSLYGRYHVVFLTVQRWCKPRAESNLFGYAEVQLIFASAKIRRQKRDVKCFGRLFCDLNTLKV